MTNFSKIKIICKECQTVIIVDISAVNDFKVNSCPMCQTVFGFDTNQKKDPVQSAKQIYNLFSNYEKASVEIICDKEES